MRLTKEELEELERADAEIELEIAADAKRENAEQRSRRRTLKGPMSASLKYYYAHREYYRQRYYDHRAENQARARAYSAQYYAEHREQEKEKSKAYYFAHLEHFAEYQKQYRIDHRDEINRKRREKRAAMKEANNA